MMNLKNHVEKLGQMKILIFLLIDLRREINEDIVFIMKAKTQIQNALLKRNFFG